MGGAWDGLGRLLGALGPLLPVFLTFKINIFCNIGPRWAPRAYWDRFWEGSGRIWKVWGRVFGTLGYLLDRFWELLAKKGPAGTDSRVRAGSAECAERLNPPHPSGWPAYEIVLYSKLYSSYSSFAISLAHSAVLT